MVVQRFESMWSDPGERTPTSPPSYCVVGYEGWTRCVERTSWWCDVADGPRRGWLPARRVQPTPHFISDDVARPERRAQISLFRGLEELEGRCESPRGDRRLARKRPRHSLPGSTFVSSSNARRRRRRQEVVRTRHRHRDRATKRGSEFGECGSTNSRPVASHLAGRCIAKDVDMRESIIVGSSLRAYYRRMAEAHSLWDWLTDLADLFVEWDAFCRQTLDTRPAQANTAVIDTLRRPLCGKNDLEDDDFECVRAEFRKQYVPDMRRILEEQAPYVPDMRRISEEQAPYFLQRCELDLRIEPAPLSAEVKQRFLHSLLEAPDARLTPAYHGTDEKNIRPICSKGFALPIDAKSIYRADILDPEANAVRVVNGQAHGPGIYTANASQASLSFAFCSGQPTGMHRVTRFEGLPVFSEPSGTAELVAWLEHDAIFSATELEGENIGCALPFRLPVTLDREHTSEDTFEGWQLVDGTGWVPTHVLYASTWCGSSYRIPTFCSIPSVKLLLCAVIDDAVESGEARTLGSFECIAESSSVRHVGDAIVVSDESRVVPLFIATLRARSPLDSASRRARWRERLTRQLWSGAPWHAHKDVVMDVESYLLEKACKSTRSHKKRSRHQRQAREMQFGSYKREFPQQSRRHREPRRIAKLLRSEARTDSRKQKSMFSMWHLDC